MTTAQVKSKISKLTIDVHIFNPIADSVASVQKKLDSILEEALPDEVEFNASTKNGRYGLLLKDVILPYILIKSREYGYRVRIDPDSYNNCQVQCGRQLKGDLKSGYYL